MHFSICCFCRHAHGMAWHGMAWHALACHRMALHSPPWSFLCFQLSCKQKHSNKYVYCSAITAGRGSAPARIQNKRVPKAGGEAESRTAKYLQLRSNEWRKLVAFDAQRRRLLGYTKTQMVAGPTMGTFCQLQNQSYLTKISEKDPRVTPNETNSDTKVTPH